MYNKMKRKEKKQERGEKEIKKTRKKCTEVGHEGKWEEIIKRQRER